MKVFVEAYLFNNFGDDLFLDILLKRYPKTKFITISNYFQTKNSNIKIYKSPFLKLNFISSLLKKLLMESTDLSISIGGSMYIEEKNRINQTPLICNNYYILGSNFGPYFSEEFLNVHKKLFSQARDVCFRDDYSYKLFKDIKSVRKGADIVFNLDTSNLSLNNTNKVVISVIDCKNRFPDKILDYENLILNFINYFSKLNYKIVLMSFCKIQGDENAVNRILNKASIKCEKYFYNGNINEALNIIADSSVVIGTRFHANILGILMNKRIIPISYSQKTNNVLKDLGYQGKIIDLQSIENIDINSLYLNDFEYQIDLNKIKNEANLQFEKLDEVLY